MKLGSLRKFDSTLELITNTSLQLEVEGITDTFEFLQNHLLFIKNKKYHLEFLSSGKSRKNGIVIGKEYYSSLNIDLKNELASHALWLALVDDVNLAISYLSRPFYLEKIKSPNDMVDGRQMGTTNVHPSAWIAQGVFIGENVKISANVRIHSGVVIMSGVEIGDEAELFPNTTIYRNVKIGERVRIHASCSIGSDGFGYNFSNGVHHKVWQMGSVVIGPDVEIGANTCVDCGTFSPTIIGRGCKIDNQVHIGHNCRLGIGVVLCGQVGMGGSTSIGDFTVMGGKSALMNGIVIGKGVQIAGGAVVTNSLLDGAIVGGHPARNIKEWMKGLATLRRISLSKTKSEEKEV